MLGRLRVELGGRLGPRGPGRARVLLGPPLPDVPVGRGARAAGTRPTTRSAASCPRTRRCSTTTSGDLDDRDPRRPRRPGPGDAVRRRAQRLGAGRRLGADLDPRAARPQLQPPGLLARADEGALRRDARGVRVRRAAARRDRARDRPLGGAADRPDEHPRGHGVPQDAVGVRPRCSRRRRRPTRSSSRSWACASWASPSAAERRPWASPSAGSCPATPTRSPRWSPAPMNAATSRPRPRGSSTASSRRWCRPAWPLSPSTTTTLVGVVLPDLKAIVVEPDRRLEGIGKRLVVAGCDDRARRRRRGAVPRRAAGRAGCGRLPRGDRLRVSLVRVGPRTEATVRRRRPGTARRRTTPGRSAATADLETLGRRVQRGVHRPPDAAQPRRARPMRSGSRTPTSATTTRSSSRTRRAGSRRSPRPSRSTWPTGLSARKRRSGRWASGRGSRAGGWGARRSGWGSRGCGPSARRP